MTNTDIFLDKYKSLEVAVRYSFNLGKYDSAVSFLKKHKAYSEYSADIDFISDVRNLLQHNPKLHGSYAVEPSDKVLEFMDFLIESVKKRVRCRDVAVKFKDISRFTMSGKIVDAVKIMRERGHSHIPIVGNHRVLGIFDENALFSVIANKGGCFLAGNPELTFKDISEYITLADRGSKKYIFASSNMYLDELEEIFDNFYRQKKRVGLVFLTQNGKETEPLQGLLTPWDVISANQKNKSHSKL